MQKEVCSLLIWVYIPKAQAHFALTTSALLSHRASFHWVEVSGGECGLKLITELLLMATLKIRCVGLFP